MLYAPKSKPEEITKIGLGYKQAVERLLQHYTPIVFGYGGNDGSLMSVLEQLPEKSVPGGIFWCYMANGDEPRQQILDVVSRQNGCLVPISGFDELMAMLGEKLGFSLPDEGIKQRAEKRATALVEHAKELRTKIQNQQAPLPDDGKQRRPVTEDQQKSLAAALKSLSVTLERMTDGKRRWWQWAEMAAKEQAKNPDQADRIYQQAVQELPDSAPLLCNYAIFLKDVRKDHDRAQEFYERALKADPNHATILGNYANFLTDVRKDHDRAQEFHERALKADPNHAAILGNYAIFLWKVRRDHDRAQEFYERALKADPNHANNLGNYAGMMFVLGKGEIANELLQRAMAAEAKDPAEGLAVELWFYSFANGPEKGRTSALARLKRLLVEQGARSPDWDLSQNVERAAKDGHPDSKWLGKLAAVVNGTADPPTLDEWPAWQNAK